jgi:hypothetical protein
VDPGFSCGDEIVFDLVDIASSTPSGIYENQTAFFSAVVLGAPGPPVVTALLDEDFDPAPAEGWSHELALGLGACPDVTYVDEWKLLSKDAEHGDSYHCGNGPGGTYGTNYSWLYPAGTDADGGPGIQLPEEALAVSMTVVHWYDTVAGEDGGQVAIDATANGKDVFATLQPVDGYPGTLDPGNCNLLGGKEAFQGSSGGWVTSVFDLTPYMGQRIWPAFVFGSDRNNGVGEGWYVDRVTVEYRTASEPGCDIARWPGVVETARFDLLGPGTIEASWSDSCNAVEFPEQTYSIQVGDLDALHSVGVYSHTPSNDRCDLLSPAAFSAGAGNEYYLVVPVGEGREGGAGTDSAGTPRPQVSTTCGERREGTCP